MRRFPVLFCSLAATIALTTAPSTLSQLGATPALAATGPAAPAVLGAPQPVGTAARALWAATQAQLFWRLRGAGVLAHFHTGSSAGQCTDIVATRRPDLIARVDMWAYARALLRDPTGSFVISVDWIAKAWARDARAAGIPTGSRPQRDAVVVFQPGAYGAESEGHVAIVDRVGRGGGFSISEMHAPHVGVVSHRSFSARQARAMRHDPKVTFIYRLPA